jgi:hypothetical protein
MSSWEEQLKGTGPQDAEQQFPGQLEAGINHSDFAIAFAPKPYLICSTTEDFFPIEGARQTYEESRRIYGVLGAEDKIAWFVGPGGHGMRRDTREAIYAWMARWLKGQADARISEPEHKVEFDEDLYATATGRVATSLGGETASTWNIKSFARLQPRRPVTDVRGKAARLTRYSPVKRPPGILERAKQAGEGFQLERIVYESEPGRGVPALWCTPERPAAGRGAVLYLDAQGKEAGFGRGGDAAELCRAGRTVLAIDLAGNGETASKRSGYSSEWFGADSLTWLTLMVGRPLLGLRIHDIVSGLGLLEAGPVAAVAKGTAGVSLLHAAVFDTRLTALVLEDPLVSYRAIAETPVHRRVFDVVLPGVLAEYDLQDLVAAIAPRPVALVNVRSPMGALMQTKDVRRHYEQAAGANTALRIGLRREGERLLDACPELR